MSHISVLLRQAVDGLKVKPFGTYLDATFGGGGHTVAICDASGQSARIIAIDADEDAIQRSKSEEFRFRAKCPIEVVHGNFGDTEAILKAHKMDELDGALFDLGLSSFQLDDSGRGFSFQKDEPLSMKMGRSSTVDGVRGELDASDVVNGFSEKGLADVIFAYGEERYARRIAKVIVERREVKPIKTTFELVDAIKAAVPGFYRFGKTHFATRTFQAIRIATNNELENITRGIEAAFEALKAGGRLSIISFHSLEDRIAKRFAKVMEEAGRSISITKKPIVPEQDEIIRNPRSRSAKLRIIEKL
jgi:16S rRNA (cytosine1402-N4)-methyltransferase